MENRMAKTVEQLTEDVKTLTQESKATHDVIVKVAAETGKTLTAVAELNKTILALQEQIANGVDTTALEAAVNELATQSGVTLAQAKATDDLVTDEV
jgi:hypothetical protein